MADELLWQGACELVEDGAVRVGTLYLLDDALVFLEGGRLPRGGVSGAKVLLALGGIFGFLFAVTGPAADVVPSREAVFARIVVGVLCAAALSLSLKAALNKREEDERLLETLAEPVALPSPAALYALLDSAPGSFKLSLSDLRQVEGSAERDVTLRSRLDDIYRMRVRPDRDGLVAAMRPRLGTGEDADGPGPA